MSNDPFPMRSEAAAKLEQGGIQDEWRSGDVATSVEARSDVDKHVLEESHGLTGGMFADHIACFLQHMHSLER